ncbi:MAG: hypothetical protein J4G16_05740 [Acidobacteria bacterium]|nr:hypothetical protein [Acidobacteriota bacterium]
MQSATRRRALFKLPWIALAALAMVAPAAAQVSDLSRGFIIINGGFQPLTSQFSESVTFTDSGGVYTDLLSGAAAHEESTFDGAYSVATGLVYDGSGGVRIWRSIGLGVGVSRYTLDGSSRVSARVPHPIFFGRDRSISGTIPLTRNETAVHLQALAIVPATRSLTVTLFGGPTFFTVEQDLVTDVRFTHAYPYDAAEFSEAMTASQSNSKIGFNVGADIAYYFSDHVGIGWLTRYSEATVGLPSVGGGAVSVQAGGLHTAGGLRLRF